MHAFILIILCAIAMPIMLAGAGKVILETVLEVVERDPKFALSALRSGAISAVIGAIFERKIDIEIPLYGAWGCLIYVLYLLVKDDG